MLNFAGWCRSFTSEVNSNVQWFDIAVDKGIVFNNYVGAENGYYDRTFGGVSQY